MLKPQLPNYTGEDKVVFDKYYSMFKRAAKPTMFVPLNPNDPFSKRVAVPTAKVMACFDEGTPEAIQAAFLQAMMGADQGAWTNPDFIRDYYVSNRWNGSGGSGGTNGTPSSVTWSFVPDGLSISGGAGEPTANSILFSTLDSAFSSQGGRTTWVQRFIDIFARWHQLTGLTYTRITVGGNDWDDGTAWSNSGAAGLRGDIRIGSHYIDGASNILAYNYFPSSGTGGNMVIDSADAANWANSSNFNRFLRNTLGHEHGHGIGIQHVCPANGTKLMEPFLNTSFDGPQQDDIRAAEALYGDPYESNATSGTATNLGALSSNSSTTFGDCPANSAYPTMPIPANSAILSIHPTGPDTDWFKFTTDGPATFTLTATPIGSSYDDSTQNSTTGACNSGNTLNSKNEVKLQVSGYSTDGSSLLGTGTAASLGTNAVATGSFPAAGTYFVKVNSSGTFTSSRVQLYKLIVAMTPGAGGNQPPVLGAIGSKTVNELSPLSFTATATDPENNGLTFSLSGAPSGASITAGGVFTWTPTEAQGPGSYSFDVVVTDNGSPNLSDSETITVTVNEVNVAPVVSNGSDVTINEGTLYSFNYDATDSDLPAQTVTFSLVNAPSGMSIQPSSGVLAWTPTEAQGPGVYDVTVRATDNGSPALSGDKVIRFTVNEVNVAPTLATIGNKTVNEGTNLTFTAVGSDTDLPAQTLTYSLVGAPTGASINPTTGVFNWTPAEDQGPNSYPFIVRVTDNGPGNLTADQNITVTVNEVNQNPVLDAIANQTLHDGDSLAVTAHATDPDLPAQTLSYSLVSPPTGMTIDSGTGAINWTPTNAQIGTNYTVTYKVSDGAGGTDQKTFQINTSVSDKTFVLSVDLRDFLGDKHDISVAFEVRNTGTTTAVFTKTLTGADLDTNGNYVFTAPVLFGTYDLAVKPSHWLRKVNANVNVLSTGSTTASFSTVNADVDGDNFVTIFDYSALSEAFDSSIGDPNFNPEADLDGDGAVTIFDYVILSQNFDMAGDD
ncbi:MAG: putative Ig domain-containing protein [Armatimonadetes bacterium]|nr:putative Ig domain-containing protein [Armatimonadota bacterium]